MHGAATIVLMLAWVILAPLHSIAKVIGPCVNCHTMHNSQAGVSVVDAGGPIPCLLNSDCIGCHTGINDGNNTTPYVYHEMEPTYGTTGTEADTLAGGNFYWVGMNDRKGHNVAEIDNLDSPLGNTPPGSVDGVSLVGEQLTCAGINGCHGDRTVDSPYKAMSGGHHNNDMTVWKNGTTLTLSYRFLDGVKGLEDPDYEYHPTDQHHNKYYGEDRTAETDSAEGTVSSLCRQCHGDFHSGSGEIASGTFGAGVWLRHPTDFDMAGATTSSEYSGYNGGTGTGNQYSVVSPVATDDTTNTLNTTVTISSQAGDAIVMCLSCHRAHGTPNDAILRWDYKGWPAGGYNGCVICHTTKN